jgi:hypothetical protein
MSQTNKQSALLNRRQWLILGGLGAVIVIIVAVVMLVLNQGATEPQTVPTAWPTETATNTPSPTPTVTDTPTMTFTPSATPTASDTPTATITPTSTATFTPTIDPTVAAIGTGTAAVEEAPVYATFTPLPEGSSPRPGTPQRFAGVVITEAQFQEEVDLKLESLPQVQQALVDFTPEGIVITLTAQPGTGVFTTGDLIILVAVDDGIARFQGALSFDADAPEPSEEFILFATNEFFLEMVEALDGILNQRLGDTHNLETLTVTEDQIQIGLLVPED